MGRTSLEETSCNAKLETLSHPISKRPARCKRRRIEYISRTVVPFSSSIHQSKTPFSFSFEAGFRLMLPSRAEMCMLFSIPLSPFSSEIPGFVSRSVFNENAQSASKVELTCPQQQQAYLSSEASASSSEDCFHPRSHSNSDVSAHGCYLLALHA